MTQEEANALPDLVPFITGAHFEDSMSKACRLVTPEIVAQYDKFLDKVKTTWVTGEDNMAYDFDRAALKQEREDALILG